MFSVIQVSYFKYNVYVYINLDLHKCYGPRRNWPKCFTTIYISHKSKLFEAGLLLFSSFELELVLVDEGVQ